MNMLALTGRRSAGWLLPAMAAAEFMLVLDVSIVNVALPSVRADLGFSESGLQWVVNAYAVTFGSFLLLGGRAADMVGGRRVFLTSLAAFTLASLACALAPGPRFLVGARALQGLSAGVLSPATLSILITTYVEESTRRRALAVWTAVAIGGGAVGGVVGGVLAEELSWRWIFLVNVPVGVAVIAAAAPMLPPSRVRVAWRRLDLAGALTVTLGLSALIWALNGSTRYGWGSWPVAVALLVAGAMFAAFLIAEASPRRARLVPLSIFRSRAIAAGNVLSFLSFLPVVATWFMLSLYLQSVRGYSPLETGVAFLPLSLAVVVASQVGFRLSGRLSGRGLYAVGALVAAAGLGLLGGLSASMPLGYVLSAAVLAMLGGGIMFAPVMIVGTAHDAADQAGLASGLLNTSRQVGGALGLALLTTIAVSATGGAFAAAAETHGYARGFAVGAAIYGLNALVGWLTLPPLRAPTGGGELS
jgi:EmrB/QacA subfamily drug resistance transporter